MIKNFNTKTLHPRRGGATLIEVLMAILIMSIGIVSIATLFPISVLRSLHATQLTHGTILRHNAEGWIDLDVNVVHDPDTLGGHLNENFIVDPMGYLEHSATFRNNFGNDGTAADLTVTRYQYTFTTDALANARFTLPDNWKNIVSDFPTATTANTVTFPLPADFTGALIASPNSRIVLIDVDGRRSETREIISAINGTGVVTWAAADPVPFAIARARIETKETMYSYLLSVRRDGVGVAQVDVVVYFRRSFNINNERVFGTTKIDADEISLAWTAGNAPKLRKGGYLYDINNGRWHRIQDVDEGVLTATLKLERPTTDNITNALFIPGIVKVYPIGSK